MTWTMDKVDHQSSTNWIEQNFTCHSCAQFIPSRINNVCGCGRTREDHSRQALSNASSKSGSPLIWDVKKHTTIVTTNAFGIIEFEGTSHPSRAHYIRISCNTKPALVLRLLCQVWNLSLPKLVISVLGDSYDVNMDGKLKECLTSGLFKAVHTTGGWIITNGINSGPSEHIGDAFASRSPKVKSNTVIIGIAPWGVIEGRDQLVGRNITVPYNAVVLSRDGNHTLNSRHLYFLLVDNGTTGSFISTYLFRKVFERYLQRQILCAKDTAATLFGNATRRIPLISLSLGGTLSTVKEIIECVTSSPVVPVVICDGSGGASDLVSFYIKRQKPKFQGDRVYIRDAIMRMFLIDDPVTAEAVINELDYCFSRRKHITIFEYWRPQGRELDHCILNSLLEAYYTSYASRLSLAISWNYVDMARDFIFNLRRELSKGALDEGMTDALATNKVDFVKLFLENGFCMQKFLTIRKLEELYNLHVGPTNTLPILLKDIRKTRNNAKIDLMDVGLLIEKLMGYGYRSSYTRRTFRQVYTNTYNDSCVEGSDTFAYPYAHLLTWAVLTKRHNMALFVWERREQALAKALIAMKLNKALAKEAEQDELSDAVSEEFLSYSRVYAQLALDVLNQCSEEDEEMTKCLLTYEIKNLSDWTCLFLAVMCNHKEFISHKSVQESLNDLWMGGMWERKYLVRKVLAGILCPPYIFNIEFLTSDELQQMPQTEEEHLQEMYSSESSDSSDSSSSDSDSSEYAVGPGRLEMPMRRRRKTTRQNLSQSIETKLPVAEPAVQMKGDTIGQGYSFEGELPTPTRDVSIYLYDPQRSSQDHFLSFRTTKDDDRSVCGSNLISKCLRMVRQCTGFRKKDKRKKHGELKARKKMYEFYNAPVTKFCENCILYTIFLVLYTYMVLIRTPAEIQAVEIVIWIYVLALFLEMVTDYMTFPIREHDRRIRTFMNFTNLCELSAILMVFVSVVFRLYGQIEFPRFLYCTNIIYWYLRTFQFFVVSKHIGPLIRIAQDNIKDLLQFLTILLIAMMAFGVNRQSIKFPHYNFSFSLIRDIFLEPYFMLYGEVYAPDIDPPCVNNGPGCEFGHWITPLTMSIYMILCNVLLLSILIARLNSTFSRISSNSSLYWKFQRYHYVMKYEAKPILPPPLNIISFVIFLTKYIYRGICEEPKPVNKGLKRFLDDDKIEAVHDFEEHCVEELFYRSTQNEKQKLENKARIACDKIDSLTSKTNELFQTSYTIRHDVQHVQSRLAQVEHQNNLLLKRIGPWAAAPIYDRHHQTECPDGLSQVHPRDPCDSAFVSNWSSSLASPGSPFNSHHLYDPNSFSQLVSIMLPRTERASDRAVNDIRPYGSSEPRGGPGDALSSGRPSLLPDPNEHRVQGHIIDRLLRRRAKKLRHAGDPSMSFVLSSRRTPHKGRDTLTDVNRLCSLQRRSMNEGHGADNSASDGTEEDNIETAATRAESMCDIRIISEFEEGEE